MGEFHFPSLTRRHVRLRRRRRYVPCSPPKETTPMFRDEHQQRRSLPRATTTAAATTTASCGDIRGWRLGVVSEHTSIHTCPTSTYSYKYTLLAHEAFPFTWAHAP